MVYTAKQIADTLDGQIIGDDEVKIYRPAKIEEACVGDISFIANGKYESFAYDSKASVLLVSKEFNKDKSNGKTLIQVDNVYEALPLLLEKFELVARGSNIVSKKASISPEAKLGDNVSVGDFSCIQEGSIIGTGVRIDANCFVGPNVEIGDNTHIYPGARIYENCKIGDNCIIHSNVVIGSDGFGFSPDKESNFKKIPQIGNVVIENEVEIGANTVIDRGTMGSTRIKSGAKLDNLIQIAHNVVIGENTVIAAQTGIAGSTKVGKNCMIGGQVGIVGHITIADGSQIQAQSGVASSITEKNKKWYGYPAISYFKYLRSFSVFKILPTLLARLETLEEKFSSKSNE